MAVLNFPDPAGQTPANTFGPATTPHATSNGVTYVWTNGSWSIASGSSSGQLLDKDTADSYYVEQTGDNMTGNLTLGADPANPEITLDATDGSAEFGGNVVSGGLPIDGNVGATLYSNGVVSARRSAGNESGWVWAGHLDNASNSIENTLDATSLILADGSATFAGAVKTEDYLWAIPNAANAGLYLEGTGTSSNRAVVIQAFAGQNPNAIELNFDGSASFAGNITAGNVSFNLEPDNDANYTVTTDVDEEGNTVETRVYNGPTLDVKERLQTKTAALEAIKTAAEDASITTLADFKAAIATALANI
jgi:hypothetical protein